MGPEAGVNGGEVIFNGPIQEFLNSKDLQSPTLSELKNSISETDRISKQKSADSFQPQIGELSVVSRKTPKIMELLSEFAEKKDLNLVSVSDQPIGKTPVVILQLIQDLADKIRDLLAKSPEAKKLKLSKRSFFISIIKPEDVKPAKEPE